MEQSPLYKIIYTEAAVLDIEEKADYIQIQLQEPGMAQSWYSRLREAIQQNLTTFPLNIPCTMWSRGESRAPGYSPLKTMWSSTMWRRGSAWSTSGASAPRAETCPPIWKNRSESPIRVPAGIGTCQKADPDPNGTLFCPLIGVYPIGTGSAAPIPAQNLLDAALPQVGIKQQLFQIKGIVARIHQQPQLTTSSR